MYENLNEMEKKFKMSGSPPNVVVEVSSQCNLCTGCRCINGLWKCK